MNARAVHFGVNVVRKIGAQKKLTIINGDQITCIERPIGEQAKANTPAKDEPKHPKYWVSQPLPFWREKKEVL